MIQLATPKEVKEKLKDITIICDTREQVNNHITDYFDKRGIPYLSRKLDVGDYSFQTSEGSYEDEIVIERKNSIDEIAGNFTVGRQRFENEFLRAKAAKTKIHLFIEKSSWQQIKSHDYTNQMKPEALMGSLFSWQAKYGFNTVLCRPEETADLMYRVMHYWFKNRIEGMQMS